jgi:fused signal recognition particle receptor
MFGKFKDKLKSWANKVVGKQEKEKIKEVKKVDATVEFDYPKKSLTPNAQKTREVITGIKKEKKKSFFEKITKGFSKLEITLEVFQEHLEDLEFLLLENNVAFEVVDKILEGMREKIIGKEIEKKDLEKELKNSLRESIEEVLIEPYDVLEKIKEKDSPYVILFCGINGSGKTTTIAKFADLLKRNKIGCVLAASDTFRAAAIDQLKKHGEKLGVEVISHDYGSDPASVGFDAVNYAKKNKIKCVLIDTAGRMYTDKNLMNEISKISRVCNPDLKIFVGEAIAGNSSVDQVVAFNEAVEIDGVILAKSDVDEKGGAALSVGYMSKKPILYLGFGQNYSDLKQFSKKDFLESLGL